VIVVVWLNTFCPVPVALASFFQNHYFVPFREGVPEVPVNPIYHVLDNGKVVCSYIVCHLV